MSAQIWWRKFSRAPGPDDAVVATPDFLIENLDDDYFGKWLQQGKNALVHTHDELLRVFYEKNQQKEQRLQIFPIADGSILTKQPTDSWYQPHLRLISLITLRDAEAFSENTDEYTLLIAGSNALTDPHGFLDVASWNGKTLRYYRRDIIEGAPNSQIGWIYFGKSEDAFDDNMAYLGAFNGHVNGACMMKEIHRPWLHWKSTQNGNFNKCLSATDLALFKKTPYLSSGADPLGGQLITQPNFLEGAVKQNVLNFFERRLENDFLDANRKLRTTEIHIRRWMAHLLWTTTVNIACPVTSGTLQMPSCVVFNDELSGVRDLIPQTPVFPFRSEHYDAAVQALGLVLMQEVPPGTEHSEAFPEFTIGGHRDKGDRGSGYQQANFLVVQHGEGLFKFTTLQASIEDALGVAKMQNIPTGVGQKKLPLLKPYTLRALVLLDFWNPIYSWQRGVLMQYVPETTVLVQSPEGSVFDLEDKFVTAVQGSSQFNIAGSPEQRFLELRSQFAASEDDGKKLFDNAVARYCDAVRSHVSTQEGVLDYMKLVESRRRVFRPLPLDEFGYTLPFAKNKDALITFVEMQSDGTIREIPDRGREFLRDYIGRLQGYSPSFPGIPNIAPLPAHPEAYAGAIDGTHVFADASVLPRSPLKLLQRPKEKHKGDFNWDDFIVPANLALPCNYSRRLIQCARKERGCPFAGRSVYQVPTPAAS